MPRATRTKSFHDVAGAFKAIEFLQLVRERNLELTDGGFPLAKPRMEEAIPLCDTARLVLARASCDWRERWITMRSELTVDAKPA